MKKYVFIMDAIALLKRLMDGRRVEGVLFIDEATGKLSFKPYNRQTYVRPKDRLIRRLEHGWVKESKDNIKLFQSVPKELGTAKVMSVIDREVEEGKDALVDWEIINFL